jgi:DNA-binding CsgD family transcriptional regulator
VLSVLAGEMTIAEAARREKVAGVRLLEQAVDELGRSPARLDHASVLTDLGAALRRAGSRTAARERLTAAVELARDQGALVLARRAPVESRTRLTASELRVAGMAAKGMSNKEIAQALFVTEKTVEVHLSNSYRKLHIRSRSQLAPALPASPAVEHARGARQRCLSDGAEGMRPLTRRCERCSAVRIGTVGSSTFHRTWAGADRLLRPFP